MSQERASRRRGAHLDREVAAADALGRPPKPRDRGAPPGADEEGGETRPLAPEKPPDRGETR